MTVALARHGESEWNASRLFTGWSDPPLSDRGVDQARRAGVSLAAQRVAVDRVYTSLLTRSTRTASIMMTEAGVSAAPVLPDWRLNERHLGRLEGLTKDEVTARWGNEQRKRWREDDRSRPPPLGPEDPRHPSHDPRYRHVRADLLPGGERGFDLARRVLDFWHERIVPDVLARRTVLVVSHVGPLRILAGHLCGPPRDAAPLGQEWPHAQLLFCRVALRPCCASTPGPPQAGRVPTIPWGV